MNILGYYVRLTNAGEAFDVEVLEAVGALLKDSVDVLCRYGRFPGDEGGRLDDALSGVVEALAPAQPAAPPGAMDTAPDGGGEDAEAGEDGENSEADEGVESDGDDDDDEEADDPGAMDTATDAAAAECAVAACIEPPPAPQCAAAPAAHRVAPAQPRCPADGELQVRLAACFGVLAPTWNEFIERLYKELPMPPALATMRPAPEESPDAAKRVCTPEADAQ